MKKIRMETMINFYINYKKILIILMAFVALQSCSTKTTKEERQQEVQIRKQEPADTPQEIAERAAAIFANAPDLTEQQKQQLDTIYRNVYDEAMIIRRDIGQTKSLMYMTLVRADYKSTEIENLKKKIVALDKKRLDLMFDALEDVQKVVGRGIDKEKTYKQLSSFNY